jgi:CDGSH-type Zn-finger protein/uncharacterized Fe-S cluster protein YjdI
MPEKVHEYEGQNVTIRYDVKRCIHARECARGLPSVFDKNAHPWINADGATEQETAQVILTCPTGALHYVSKTDGAQEKTPDTNQMVTVPNGPHYVRGDLEVRLQDGTVLVRDSRIALCRCGASNNKPFCDNSHLRIGFRDDATWTHPVDETASPATGKVVFTPLADAFMQVDGNMEIRNAAGQLVYRGNDVALCRCGGSSDKPFCDGTHSNNGFRDEAKKTD